MHQNPAYRNASNAKNLDFARARGFGMLCVNSPSPTVAAPLVSHIPFFLSENGRQMRLHLMRSNPIVPTLDGPAPAAVAVTGPDSYISPDWYEVVNQVPTWNYAAVHLRGTLTRAPQDSLGADLDRLAAVFETRLGPKPPWTSKKMPPEALDRMMRMIIPFRLDIDDIQGTWKLAQNKPAAARISAAKQVAAYGIGQETARLSALMQAPPDDPPDDPPR